MPDRILGRVFGRVFGRVPDRMFGHSPGQMPARCSYRSPARPKMRPYRNRMPPLPLPPQPARRKYPPEPHRKQMTGPHRNRMPPRVPAQEPKNPQRCLPPQRAAHATPHAWRLFQQSVRRHGYGCHPIPAAQSPTRLPACVQIPAIPLHGPCSFPETPETAPRYSAAATHRCAPCPATPDGACTPRTQQAADNTIPCNP